MNSRGEIQRQFLAILGLVLVATWGAWEGWNAFRAPPPAQSTPTASQQPVTTLLPQEKLAPIKKPAVTKVLKQTRPLVTRPAALSPKIVAPMVPPAPSVIPPIVPPPSPPEPQEWRGTDTTITHSGQVVIRNDHQWIQFWSEHRPHEAAPDIDFTNQMVIGVFAGPRPAEAFAIQILNVRNISGVNIVDYQEKLPPPGTLAFNVTVYPYDIKVIPQLKGTFKFNKLAVVDPRRQTH